MSTFSKAAQAAAVGYDKPVSGGSKRFFTEGEHECRVEDIDIRELSQDKITVTYTNREGASYQDRFYVMAANRKTGEQEFTWRFSKLIAALLPAEESYAAFFAEVQKGNAAVLAPLKHMHVGIVLKRGPGYGQAEKEDNQWTVRDTKTGEVVGVGGTIDEARQAAEAVGHKRAYLNVTEYVPTEAAANITAFAASLASLNKPRVTSFPPLQGKRVAGSDVPF